MADDQTDGSPDSKPSLKTEGGVSSTHTVVSAIAPPSSVVAMIR